MLNWIAFFITSGLMFVIGILMIIMSLLIKCFKKSIWSSVSRVVFLLGIILVVASTTAVPLPLAMLFILSSAFYILINSFSKYKLIKMLDHIACTLVLASTLGLLLSEIPYLLFPRIVLDQEQLYIFGDSLTAGLNERTVTTYPNLLNSNGAYQVMDLSVGGSKIKDGLNMARNIGEKNQIVLIELGGNDWRIGGEQNIREYEIGAEELMKYLSDHNHRMIMLEIPFPPFEYQLAYAQRAIVKKYNIRIVPRRFLAEILFLIPNSTSDGIHLTQEGHNAFAEQIKNVIVRS